MVVAPMESCQSWSAGLPGRLGQYYTRAIAYAACAGASVNKNALQVPGSAQTLVRKTHLFYVDKGVPPSLVVGVLPLFPPEKGWVQTQTLSTETLELEAWAQSLVI